MMNVTNVLRPGSENTPRKLHEKCVYFAKQDGLRLSRLTQSESESSDPILQETHRCSKAPVNLGKLPLSTSIRGFHRFLQNFRITSLQKKGKGEFAKLVRNKD